MNRANPLRRQPLTWPARVAAAIARHGCFLADVWTRVWTRRQIARRGAPDLPEAVGASDAELRRLANTYRRDPDEAVRAAHSAATLLSRWWT